MLISGKSAGTVRSSLALRQVSPMMQLMRSFTVGFRGNVCVEKPSVHLCDRVVLVGEQCASLLAECSQWCDDVGQIDRAVGDGR